MERKTLKLGLALTILLGASGRACFAADAAPILVAQEGGYGWQSQSANSGIGTADALGSGLNSAGLNGAGSPGSLTGSSIFSQLQSTVQNAQTNTGIINSLVGGPPTSSFGGLGGNSLTNGSSLTGGQTSGGLGLNDSGGITGFPAGSLNGAASNGSAGFNSSLGPGFPGPQFGTAGPQYSSPSNQFGSNLNDPGALGGSLSGVGSAGVGASTGNANPSYALDSSGVTQSVFGNQPAGSTSSSNPNGLTGSAGGGLAPSSVGTMSTPPPGYESSQLNQSRENSNLRSQRDSAFGTNTAPGVSELAPSEEAIVHEDSALRRALSDLHCKNYDQCKVKLDKVLEDAPHNAQAHYLKAVMFVMTRHYSQAEQEYQLAIKYGADGETTRLARAGLAKLSR